jgi:RNA polymerase sigma-70 factor, ECF subfamily
MQTFASHRGMLSAVTRRDTATSRGANEPEPVEPPATAEADLVARARRGEAAAFEEIVRLHLPRVWAVVWRMLRQHEDSEDVVQEVFLAAHQGLAGFRGEARLSTWLHRIAVTRALNHRDRAVERASRASRPLDEDLVAPATGAGGSGSPLQALQADELQRRLAGCLDKLPRPFRAILTLRDVDELPYEAIAATLGIALGTVRSRLARARLALRQCVSGETP